MFGYTFYISAYSGPCQRSESISSPVLDARQSLEFACPYDHLDIIIDIISLPVQPNFVGKLI